MPELARQQNTFDLSGLPEGWNAELKVSEQYNPHRFSVYWVVYDEAGKDFDTGESYSMTDNPELLVSMLEHSLSALAGLARNYVENKAVLGL